MKIIGNDNNLPFGRMLFLRVHVTFGVGLPEAEHSILTDDPFLTCKCPPELMWWILGGTENGKKRNENG